VNESRTDRWQLPDGVNELLPEAAWRVETLRRLIMDNSYLWGYELVMPPLIEYLDSLLTGTGETLDVQTFKIIDQHTGRSLGIRADMTPQVARIDAHTLRSDTPNRLFYTGSVLRARTDGAGSSRTPLQFGAELFGHEGPDSDVEVIQLMLDNVMISGLEQRDLLLDLGHVGIYRGLIQNAKFPADIQERLFQALLKGSRPEVESLLEATDTRPEIRQQFQALASLSGKSHDVLERARQELGGAGDEVSRSLNNLQFVIDAVTRTYPSIKVHVDLAELRGYRYHTGMLFAAYDESGSELARGGRYDAIGEAFGYARPATGFSGDLINLALAKRPIEKTMAPAARGIWVAGPVEPQVWQKIQALRKSGERVVISLTGSTMDAASCHCDRLLLEGPDGWHIQSLDSSEHNT
jgi:ATP phosphoribosyltransferase regulatory subunit